MRPPPSSPSPSSPGDWGGKNILNTTAPRPNSPSQAWDAYCRSGRTSSRRNPHTCGSDGADGEAADDADSDIEVDFSSDDDSDAENDC